MKLIRTLIESKLGDGAMSSLGQSEEPALPRLRNSAPVSEALKARSVLSDSLDNRLKAFKTDLAELAPLQKTDKTSQKPKRVWDMDAAEKPAANTQPDTPPRAETASAEDGTPTLPVTEVADEAQSEPVTEPGRGRSMRKASALRMFEVPPPMQPRRPLTIGRKKTRIMGFGGEGSPADLLGMTEEEAAAGLEFPVGWLVIIEGPGRGTSFVLQNPVSAMGRAEGQTITLNFGDDTISRQNHAAVAYDDQMNACFLGFGGKANLVRLNGRPVLSTEQLTHGDVIRVGETDLKYIALCGPDFSWQDKASEKARSDG